MKCTKSKTHKRNKLRNFHKKVWECIAHCIQVMACTIDNFRADNLTQGQVQHGYSSSPTWKQAQLESVFVLLRKNISMALFLS